MAERRHLTNAPIQEALVDLHFDAIDFEVISKFVDELNIFGATVTDLWTNQITFENSNNAVGPHADQVLEKIGRRVAFGSSVIQWRKDGVTFSKTPKYENWEKIENDARHIWLEDLPRLGIDLIKRVALRYVNVLEIRLPVDDFSLYMHVPPELPSNLPQSIVNYISRSVSYDAESKDTSIVTQLIEPLPNRNDAIRLVLDIDVFNFEPVSVADDALTSILKRLRALKNDIFFSYLTDKALEQYL